MTGETDLTEEEGRHHMKTRKVRKSTMKKVRCRALKRSDCICIQETRGFLRKKCGMEANVHENVNEIGTIILDNLRTPTF